MDTKKELKKYGIRYTVQRSAVLDVLKNSEGPQTITQLRSKLGPSFDLSTIYRTLDIFEKKHLVTKTVLQEPLQNVYDYNRHQHNHHLICTVCEKIIVIEGCPLGDYEAKIAEETGYTIERHQLELYGVCPECRSKQ